MQRKITDSLKQRLLICFVWLPVFPFLLYYGYCWGWWGHGSLSLQHYFQCKCPSDSEKARYPKEAEILFSACSYPYSYPLSNHSSLLSPDSRFLIIREFRSRITDSLSNLETGRLIPTQSIVTFLTIELIDLSTQRQYPVQPFSYLQSSAYTDGELNHQIFVDTLRRAKGIYLFEEDAKNGHSKAFVLMSEFPTNIEKDFIFDLSDLGEPGYNDLEQFLAFNNIRYTVMTNNYPGEVMSPDGRFMARNDGIYLTATNQKIVEGVPRLLVRSWTVDGKGAIYTADLEPCFPTSPCDVAVSQPVIKLKVPETYMVYH